MKVSVLMVTYNHEKYIEQAVRSALMQRTTFDYEIVVGEDCSTDGTADVLRRLEAESPGRLRVLYAEKNLGMMRNYARTFAACRGEYLAFLEGDDYWTARHKLQVQADYLDAHPECILCFHDLVAFVEGVPQDLNPYAPPPQEITGLEEVLEDLYINAGTVLMRLHVAPPLPPWTHDLIMGDWPLFIHLAQYGKFGHIAETMGAYRRHPGGVGQRSTIAEQTYAMNAMYDGFNAQLGYKYDAQIQVLKRRWAAQIPLVKSVERWMNEAHRAQAEADQWRDECRTLRKQLKALGTPTTRA
jgi:glycosyltransferase involved in cell wall biosynthesis